MRAQYSLRTLIVVMTLGGPLLAAGISAAPKVVNWLSPNEVTWDKALADAQKVQTIGGGFQTVSKADSN